MASEWRSVTFSELCDIKRGASPRPIQDWLAPTGIPWVKIADASASGTRSINRTGDHIRPEGQKHSVSVVPGDLILSNSATPGIPKFMGIHACIHDGWLLLRNFRNLDKLFCYYLLLQERPKLVQQGNGSVFTNLKTDILKNHVVSIPGIGEQQLIAATLGALDDKIALLRETNATLEAIAQALFKSWFVDFDPVRAKRDGRDPIGVPPEVADLFPSEFEDSALGEIPKGWRICPFAETVNIIGGGTPKTSVTDYWGGDIPWFSVVDAPAAGQVFTITTEKSITKLGVDNSSTRILPKWTTIISARGTVGKLALTGVEMAMNQSCYGLTPRASGGETATYLAAQRLVEDLKHLAHGGVFDTITRDTLNSVLVCDPPPEIIQAFDALTRPLFERILANGLQSCSLTEIRDTLLPRLISGKLRLPEALNQLEDTQA